MAIMAGQSVDLSKRAISRGRQDELQARRLHGAATVSPGTVLAQTVSRIAVTVPYLMPGDTIVFEPNLPNNLGYDGASVTARWIAEVRVSNPTAGNIVAPSASWPYKIGRTSAPQSGGGR